MFFVVWIPANLYPLLFGDSNHFFVYLLQLTQRFSWPILQAFMKINEKKETTLPTSDTNQGLKNWGAETLP